MNLEEMIRLMDLFIETYDEMIKCEGMAPTYYLSEDKAKELDKLIEKYQKDRERLT